MFTFRKTKYIYIYFCSDSLLISHLYDDFLSLSLPHTFSASLFLFHHCRLLLLSTDSSSFFAFPRLRIWQVSVERKKKYLKKNRLIRSTVGSFATGYDSLRNTAHTARIALTQCDSTRKVLCCSVENTLASMATTTPTTATQQQQQQQRRRTQRLYAVYALSCILLPCYAAYTIHLVRAVPCHA